MDLREKRKNELESQKNQRKEEVIAAAIEIFIKEGIEKSKIVDIAEKAEIGVASVYRYFKTKPEIVIEAACKFWRNEISELNAYYLEEAFLKKDGLTRVREILEVFLKLYLDHKDFMNFIDEFDRYVVKEKITKEKLFTYEKNIIDLKPFMLYALESGKQDGTINKALNSEQFYFSINHALMSMCQKLILTGDVLESDNYVKGEEQIKIIIEMAVKYISEVKE